MQCYNVQEAYEGALHNIALHNQQKNRQTQSADAQKIWRSWRALAEQRRNGAVDGKKIQPKRQQIQIHSGGGWENSFVCGTNCVNKRT